MGDSLYYALQAIHPYSDGNGRTGRLLYEIISEDGKELTEERLSEFLDHDMDGQTGTGKGRDVFAEKVLDASSAYYYINREVAKEILGADFSKEHGSIYIAGASGAGSLPKAIEKNLLPEQVLLVKKILGEASVRNFSFRGILLAKLLQEKPDLQKYQYGSDHLLSEDYEVIAEDIGKKFFSVDGEALMENLSEDDVRQLIEIHKEVKIKFIKSMIDIFSNPEDHKIKTKDGEGILIKSVFRKGEE